MSEKPFTFEELLKDRKRIERKLETAQKRLTAMKFTLIGCNKALETFYPEELAKLNAGDNP